MKFLKNSKLYEEEMPNMNQIKDEKLSLIHWHQRLGYLNFIALRKYLAYHKIIAIDNTKDHIYNSCKKAKAIKRYNRIPQQKVIKPYQYIHINLVGPITSIGFGDEQYFFIFIDNDICITKMYIIKQKNKWFKYLKVFYNLTQIWTKLDRLIERL